MDPRWQTYDRPELLEAVSTPLAGGRREVLLAVDGVHCGACVRGVERALAGVASDVRVNLASRTVEFVFAPQAVPLSEAIERLDRAGYRPQVLAQDQAVQAGQRERRAALARVGVAVICAMQVMMLAWPEYFDVIDPGVSQLLRWTQWLLATPAVFYSGWPFLAAAWRSLRDRSLGMDVPVAASILIAYFASAWRVMAGEGALYFDAATMFVMLLGTGRYLEGRSRALAGERLRLLAGRRALTAVRIEDGEPRNVPLIALQAGDVVRVAPGEALPADGQLLDAAADLDEALLSGESHPVRHLRDARLLAGSLNVGARAIDLKVSNAGNATRLAAITRLLQEAQRDKPPAQLLADRIAGRFVLAVLLLALAATAWWWPRDPEQALNVLLAVLVVSCPCALSLAMPAVYAAASSRLAAAGVLLAHPSALARLPHLSHALFDKTGTLTEASLRLVAVRPLAELGDAEALAIAAALEQPLQHPIARALVAAAGRVAPATEVELDPQGGVLGKVAGQGYWLGAPERLGLVAEGQPASADAANTWVALAREGRALALFGLAAQPRPDAAAALAALRQEGVSLQLASGDSEAAVRQLARQLGIAEAQWRQTPEQKLTSLRALQQQGAVVMAVGDGINDAPLLAAADIGIAMPGGAALAQARADVILTGDSLAGLRLLRQVAAQAARRVRENLGWALGYNLVMLPLAFSGALTPWLAALGMSISSLLVVANALRVAPPAPQKTSGRSPPTNEAAVPATGIASCKSSTC
ncbi:cadmium-translocating P-type ATPase [Stagnimonas aquatica]|uniref:Cadmium-translocating P-type ATPase n=1 Tax=Stagnimonas aquatica TaxID=2689987 RepID=A0A3N0VLG1_9GAMM|nr:cation-translocating P-type ATPase [Stagnimonas aquatica]ROH93575.1 cadmium-translocating P-type ATPase [Stagnimonas aquatica]